MLRSLRKTRATTAIAVVSMAAGSLTLALPTSAYASGTGKILASPCLNMRTGPSTTSALAGACIPVNTVVTITCTASGQSISGPYGATTLWDYTSYGGKVGYVSDAWVYTGTAGAVAPTCGSTGTPRSVGQKRYTNSGAWGNCTWGAYDIWYRTTGYYPALTGDAMNWDNSARATGWTVVLDAEPRSIVVFEPYVQGASYVGHVAWVNSVENRADGRYINITEMNAKGLNVWSTRTVKDVVGMSYILAP